MPPPSVSPVYIQDATGQVWQITVTPGGGNIPLVKVYGVGTQPTYYDVEDAISEAQLWQLTVTPSGIYNLQPISGSSNVYDIFVTDSTGAVWEIQAITQAGQGILRTQAATLTATATSIASNLNPSTYQQSVIFSATVMGGSGPTSPTGTITFYADSNVIATVAVTASAPGAASASVSTSYLTVGNHYIYATYNGDYLYSPSTSSVLQQVVQTACPFPLSFVLQELANRLYDSTFQFWSQAELTLYVQEAFRTWNALTSYWRGDFVMESAQGAIFYDSTNTTTAPNTLRPMTVTDVQMYTLIEYHLLEPPVGAGPWTGSLQFTLDDILNAVQRRHNEMLGVTGCTLSHSATNATPDRIQLPNTVLDLVRVAYSAAVGGSYAPLFQDDTWAMQSYRSKFTTQDPGVPTVYRVSTEPLLAFDADVPPLPGTYDLLLVDAGAVLSLITPSTFSVPDDWTWVLKWGALADLLGRESNAKDPVRQKYCEQRYQQGLSLLGAASAVLAARINNQPALLDAVVSADQYNTTWQGLAQGTPTEALTAGLNLIALSPPPSAGPFSVLLTVVENAPIPVAATDCCQLTQDIYDIILDYAQHLATFKQGGAEFMATQPHLTRFLAAAALYSSKLAQQGEFSKMLYAISQGQSNMSPRYTGDAAEDGE